MKYSIVPVTPLMQNCSLIWCEETMKGAAVDPGGDLDVILKRANEKGVELEKILVTHGHADHAGGVAELAEMRGLPIEGPHPDDSFWIDGMPQQAAMFNLPGARVFTPDRWLADGEMVTVGKARLQVFHCPGHTPGHVVFFEESSRLALVGDVLFKGSIGRTDFPMGDHATLIRSIRENLWPLGDDVTFIPGHGPNSTFGEERRNNPFVAD
jgi:glyoxylase-like metal-dependent hydrolase (beta-lactamase superfamily II)